MCSFHESCGFTESLINAVDVDGCTKWSKTDYKNKWFSSKTGYRSCALGHPSCFMQLCLGINWVDVNLQASMFHLWSAQIHNASLYVHNRLNHGVLSSALIHGHWPSMKIWNALYLLMKKHRFGTMWINAEWMSLFMYRSPLCLVLFSQHHNFVTKSHSICLNT